MVNLKLWFKKLQFNKKKSIFLFIFLILPLVLFSCIILNFLNGYYDSFEEYSYQNIGSDLSFYSDNDNFQEIYNTLENSLNDYPYIGFMSYTPFYLELNLTIYNLFSPIPLSFINHSLSFKILNFSSDRIKNLYIDKEIPLISGRLPKNGNEIIVPDRFKIIYNFSLNSVLNFQFHDEVNLNTTIVGFYEGNENIRRAPKASFIFLMGDLENQVFQKFKEHGSSVRYRIYLDHKHMDIFNIYSFTQQLSQIETILQNDLSNYLLYDDVFSSSSMYQSFEFNQYILDVMLNLFSLIVPILLIILLFLTISSNYISNIEKDYWHKITVYSSRKSVKLQIFLELFLNNFIAYLITVPVGIGLYVFSLQLTNLKFSGLEIYLPFSYFSITFFFSIICSLLIFIFLVKKYVRTLSSKNGSSKRSFVKFSKKYWKIILILIILAFLPIFSKILYFGLISFYNPLLVSFSMILDLFVFVISLFYSTILILLIVLLTSGLIIKFVQYLIKNQPFTRIKNQKFEFIKKFFQYKNKSILILITILGLFLGFINFYHFKNHNQYLQNQFEIYLDYGSDFKIYDYYSYNGSFNPSDYADDSNFCQIKSIPGKINNNTIFDDNIALLTFNPDKYLSVLNEKTSATIDLALISNIKNLKVNEILVPVYLQFRYNLQVGDYLAIQPKNTTTIYYEYEYEFVENYTLYMRIKGFINNLPGMDQDPNFFASGYSSWKMVIITNSNFNYSSVFSDLPIKRTYLVKDFNNSLNVLKAIKVHHLGVDYTDLQDELKNYDKSYLSVSNNSLLVLYTLFIIVFLSMTFLFIYNFISENSDFWDIFQLFGLNERSIKSFILIGLSGIVTISFFIGLVGGFLSGVLSFLVDNLNFKNFYYLYPIQIQFDPLGLIFNLLYILISLFIIWIISKKIIKFPFKYENLRKYNPV